ncbi:MAG: hypothetical protein IPP69_17595 [Flavobacteriales bacterium]|nr:hypothetical protein [Flavobacteriales bacterium]
MVNLIKPKTFPISTIDKMMEKIILEICEAENLNPIVFKSKHKGQEYVEVRQIYAALMYDKFVGMGISLARVGRTINRDHATVKHCCKVVQDRIEIWPNFPSRVAHIESIIDAVIRPWLYPNTREYLSSEIYKLKQKIEKHEQELHELDEIEGVVNEGDAAVAVRAEHWVNGNGY